MRIGWATPFHERSNIAKVSLYLARELRRRGHDVDILRLEPLDAMDAPLDVEGFAIRHGYDTAELKANYDIVVANLGDHSGNHCRVLEILTMVPAVVIFHDADISNYTLGMADLRGIDVRDMISDFELESPSEQRIISHYAEQQLALIAALAGGAVVHAPHYEDAVKSHCPGPVRMFPLAGPENVHVVPERRTGSDFCVTTFGHINANKQPERVLRAIAATGERGRRTRFALVGTIDDAMRERLTARASQLRLPAPIFTGWISDEELSLWLASSDLICCLRHPVLEGGSGSLITALYSGRPVIVSDVASYAMVPDDFVWKVSYGTDSADVAAAIRSILSDLPAASRRSQRAAEWAMRTYSASSYVDALVPLLDAAIRAQPGLRAARQIGGTLEPVDAICRDRALQRYAAAGATLFASVE